MLRTLPAKPFIKQVLAGHMNVLEWCDSNYQDPSLLHRCVHPSVAGDNGSLENYKRELQPHMLIFPVVLLLAAALRASLQQPRVC